jgi:WD40 repeat protein
MGTTNQRGAGAVIAILAVLTAAGTALAQGEPDIIWQLSGHSAAADGVAFSPDGQIVASGGDDPDSSVKLWQAADGEPLETLPGHVDGVTDVAFSPDGRLVAASYLEHSDGPYLIFNGVVNVWDVDSATVIHTFPGYSASFSADGQRIVSGGGGISRHVYVHRVDDGQRIMETHTGTYVMTAAISPDGETVTTGNFDGEISVWDVSTGDSVDMLDYGSEVRTMAFSPDGELLAAAGGGTGPVTTIKLWRLSDGELLQTLDGHDILTACVRFSPDGETLISSGTESGYNRTIHFWRVSDGEPLEILDPAGSATVNAVAYSPNGGRFAYVRNDGSVAVAVSPVGGCFGDLDDDGVIGLADLAALLSHYGTSSGAGYPDGDLDGDGAVGLADLGAFLAVYESPCDDRAVLP